MAQELAKKLSQFLHSTDFSRSYQKEKEETSFEISSREMECGNITDYRTFRKDFRKCAEFVRWLKEKTEGWDSQPFGSVFALTSDTPISSVMTADFLYPTKAKACVRSYFDKHRVNHLDSHPDLSAISSLNHGWLFCSVKNYWKEVVGIVPDVLRYAIPLFGYG